MNLNKISFSGSNALNVCSDDFKYKTLQHIYEQYNINITDRNSRLYQEKYKQHLVNGDYFISLKTSGTPYLLYFTKHEDINICLFIDKKVLKGYKYPRMIFTRYRFDDEIYNNTLVEGELLKNKNGKWAFIIEDIQIYCGKNIFKFSNFNDRINKLYNMLNEKYTKDDDLETIPLYVKKYFTYNDIDYLKNEYIKTIDFNFQGVYFTPYLSKHPRLIFLTNFLDKNEDKEVKKQDNKQIRKNDNKHTITNFTLTKPDENEIKNLKMDLQKPDIIKDKYTFKITKTHSPGIYQLYCEKTGNLVKHSVARINTVKCSKFIKQIFKTQTEENVYCTFDKQFKKWVPQEISKEPIDNYNDIKYITESD